MKNATKWRGSEAKHGVAHTPNNKQEHTISAEFSQITIVKLDFTFF